MPVLSPHRSASSGGYRSAYNSSLERPFYNTSYSPRISSYSERFSTRSYTDADGRRIFSRSGSITEDGVTTRFREETRENSLRRDSLSRDSGISSIRESSISDYPRRDSSLSRGDREESRRLSTINQIDSLAELRNKYSPANYVPACLRRNENISRSKSINDIGLPPIEVAKLSAKKKVNDSLNYNNSIGLISNNTNYDNGDADMEDDNGNRTSVADLRKKFDEKPTPVKAQKGASPPIDPPPQKISENIFKKQDLQEANHKVENGQQNGEVKSLKKTLQADGKSLKTSDAKGSLKKGLTKKSLTNGKNSLTNGVIKEEPNTKDTDKDKAGDMLLVNRVAEKSKLLSEKVKLLSEKSKKPSEKGKAVNGLTEKPKIPSEKTATKGVENVTNGLEKVVNGEEKVVNRMDKVTNGVEKLSNGVDTITDGVEKLTNGVEVNSELLVLENGVSNNSSNSDSELGNGVSGSGTGQQCLVKSTSRVNNYASYYPTKGSDSGVTVNGGLDCNGGDEEVENDGNKEKRPNENSIASTSPKLGRSTISPTTSCISSNTTSSNSLLNNNNNSLSNSTNTTNSSSTNSLQRRSVDRDRDRDRDRGTNTNSYTSKDEELRPSIDNRLNDRQNRADRLYDRTNSSSGSPVKTLGLNGLKNIGNTCFMNSVIQCLSNTKLLLEYVRKDGYVRDVNTSISSMKGALIKAFAEVLKEVWSEDSCDRVVNTVSLKSQIQRFAPRFMGYAQQDAQEFLRYLLEGLHEDVNRVIEKPKPIHTEIDEKLSDSEKAKESWSRYLRMDNSKIVDIFVGQLKSTLRCTHCGHASVTFDPFWDLSLPIPSRTGQLRLSQCLDSFTREETLDGDEKPTCSKCKERRKCTKSFAIQKFPKILVIHLKRFSPTERFRGKLSCTVDFPLEGLDMLNYAAEGVSSARYNLYAVSNHSGTTYSGHYTAYCRHPYTHTWHEYNDSRVSSISPKTVVSSEAYVLFYELEGQKSHL